MNADTLPVLPPTSLIICSRNRPKLLLETVQPILRGDELPTEIVIIDQSNTPHPVLASLKTDCICEIRYQWVRSVGLDRARNTAIATAQHNILVFTDDDVVVTSTWFGTLVRGLLSSRPRTVVIGRVLPTEAETAGGFVLAIRIDQVPAVYEGRIGKDMLITFNMAMYRSTIDDIGCFDERLGPGTRLPAAEDNDFGFRLLEAGYRIVYVPEALLYHRAWRPGRDYFGLRWSYGRGQGAFYAKYFGLRDRYMIRRMCRDINGHVLRFPRRVRWRHRQAIGDMIYVLGLLSGAGEWLLTQRKMR